MLAEQAASYSLLGGGGGDGDPALPGKWIPGIGGGALPLTPGGASCVIEDAAAGLSARSGALGGFGAAAAADGGGGGGGPSSGADKMGGPGFAGGAMDVTIQEDQGGWGL